MKGSYVLTSADQETLPSVPWLSFLLLTVLFFLLGGHDFKFSLVEHFDQSAEVFETQTTEGNPLRRLAAPLLGLFAIILLYRQGISNLSINGVRGWILLFYIVFVMLTFFWSVESSLTSRRLLIFIIYWLLALAFANRYWITAVPYFAFISSTIFVFTGVLAELANGTFHPIGGDYRFMGTVHPNMQAISCSIMFISAAVIYNGRSKNKFFFLAFALIGLGFLILTKSRTSFVTSLAVVSMLAFMSSQLTMKKIFVISGVICGAGLLGFFAMNVGGEHFNLLSSGVNLGRNEGDINSMNGRLRIWSLTFDYIKERLFIGYGYDSFWTVQHIYAISLRMGFGIISAHNAYIESILGIGVIGTAAYITFAAISLKKAFIFFRRDGNIGYAFHTLLLAYFFIQGLTESNFTMLSYGVFFLLVGFANIAFLPAEREESPDIRWLGK